MVGRDEIREAIRGAAEGATCSVESLASIGVPVVVEGFDVEVTLGEPSSGRGPGAVIRFSLVAAPVGEIHRSVA